mgnify:CR=1 FL=1
MYRWWHFLAESAARALTIPDVPASDLPALIQSRWLLPGPLRRPPPGVSHFRCFRCYLDLPPIPHGSLRHPPLPGVSRFRHFRCYLDRPPAPHGLLRYPPLPDVSRFRRIDSHLHRVTKAPDRHYGGGRTGTDSLLRCFCVEQEAARSRCAAQQDISSVPYR